MTRTSSIGLGLAIAIALTTGSVLTAYPPLTKEAPGAFSDITIAEADSQKLPPPSPSNQEKAPDTTAKQPPTAEVERPNLQSSPGEESKGIPPRNPQP
jgi:hypothetical protein